MYAATADGCQRELFCVEEPADLALRARGRSSPESDVSALESQAPGLTSAESWLGITDVHDQPQWI